MLKVIHLKKILHHHVRILLQAISRVVDGAALGTEEVVRTESTVAVYFNILILSAADQYNYVYCTLCFNRSEHTIVWLFQCPCFLNSEFILHSNAKQSY